MTREQMQEAFDLLAAHGTMSAAARATGIPVETLRYRYHKGIRAAEKGEFGTDPVIPGFRIAQVSTKLDANGDSVQEFVQQRPARGGAYQPTSDLLLKGKTTFVDVVGDERLVTREVYMERRAGETDPAQLVDILQNAFSSLETRAPLISAPRTVEKDTLTVFPLIDWHVGLMAWALETGENYDLKIARKAIMGAMRRLIAATPASEEAVVLGIGDLLHWDGFVQETPTSRHPLDGDGRYPKVLDVAADMVEETIELVLSRHRKVYVRILRGNHDEVSAVAIGAILRRLFRGHKRVTVDDNQSYQFWLRRGKVFLGGSHGDKAKMRDLPMLMAHDRPEDWSASTYRKIYTGHIHHESRIEQGGVIVESMRSPVAKDAYHSFNKWRSGRSVYSETFNLDGSEAAAIRINL